MKWNLEGYHVSAIYLENNYVNGTVIESRVVYGGDVRHTLLLDRPAVVHGTKLTHVVLNHDDITTIGNLVGKPVY